MTQRFTVARHPRRAHYLYAGQAATGKLPVQAFTGRPGVGLPPWLGAATDLNFLDPTNPYFHVDRALYSFGPHIGGSVPVTMFGRAPGVTILGDSGGFQFIANPSAFKGDQTREWVLTTLEHDTDEAMTLDIPTAAISSAGHWPDFDSALSDSLESLRFFDRHRAHRTRFLNVLQGRDRREALAWYEAVKWFPASGWAFGGAMRRDWGHLVTMLRRMADDGLLGRERNRVHILGVGDLTGAVLLSAIQRGMQERLGDDGFLVTYDASSPSYLAGKRKAYSLPRLDEKSFTLETWSPPVIARPDRATATWPFKHTAVGARMTIEDVCAGKSGMARTSWDQLSETLIVHHNVNALLWAIDAANSVLELHPDDAEGLAPPAVIAVYQALRLACLAADPVSYLRPYAAGLRPTGASPVGQYTAPEEQ